MPELVGRGSLRTEVEMTIMRGMLAIGMAIVACGGAVAGEIERGRALVEANCATCHAIGPEGASPLAAAPPFRELHKRYDVEFLSEALVEGIVTAHEGMPEFVFEPVEAAEIVAYLRSLEPAAEE